MRFEMNNIHTIFESAKSKNCVPSEHADETGAKIDATLGDSDLIGLFDNICPIRGDVFASMKDAAADPKNLKLTMVKTEDLGEATKIYIEAVEFATFCEAADLNIGEAAEEILDTCKGMVPGSNDSELHVVFPSEALNKGELGSTRFGRDVRNDWAMQLLTGCRRYGIHVNSGVEDGEPVTESAYKNAKDVPDLVKKAFEHKIKNSSNSTMNLKDLDSWDAPANGSDKTVDQMSDDELKKKNKDAYYIKKGLPFHESDDVVEEGFGRRGFRDVKPLRDDKDGDKDDDKFTTRPDGSKWQNSIDLPDDNDGWVDSINLGEATTESKTLKGVKIYIDGPSKKIDVAIKLCNKNWSRIVNEAANRMFKKASSRNISTEKFKDADSVRKNLKLEGAMYDNEGNKYNPICGTMNLSFDTVPSLDPHHLFTLYVDFDKDKNIKFDSIYDG